MKSNNKTLLTSWPLQTAITTTTEFRSSSFREARKGWSFVKFRVWSVNSRIDIDCIIQCMSEYFPPRKRFRLEYGNMSGINTNNFGWSFSADYDMASKTVPRDMAEFLSCPFQYRVTEEFLHRAVVDVRISFVTLNYISRISTLYIAHIGKWECLDSLRASWQCGRSGSLVALWCGPQSAKQKGCGAHISSSSAR